MMTVKYMENKTQMQTDDFYGNIPSDWSVLTVEDLVRQNIIFPPKDGNHGNIHPKNKDFVKKGIPFIMASDLINGEIDYKDCKKISKNQAKQLQKGFAENGDILLSHKATLGRTAIVEGQEDYIVLTPQVTYYRIKDENKLSNQFLYSLFSSSRFQKVLKVFSGGSTRDYIGITAQLEIPILYPPIEEQLFIVNVHQNIEKKINILRNQNQTLEKIAQTLFKQWFVDFNFPGENGEPYKDSGGEMVASELGEIPMGWKISPLKRCISNLIDNRGKTPKYVEEGIPALSAKFVKGGDLVNRDKFNYVSSDLFESSEKLKSNDIIMTSEAPLGELYYISENINFYPAQRVFAIRANSQTVLSSYLYYWLGSYPGQYLIKRRGTGSTVQGIKQSELKECEVIIPEFEIMKEADDFFRICLLKKEINEGKIQTLIQTRDTMLPKLMSGKIRVSD